MEPFGFKYLAACFAAWIDPQNLISKAVFASSIATSITFPDGANEPAVIIR